MSDAQASDVLLGTVARNIFLAGYEAAGGQPSRAEAAWNEYVPCDADINEVQELDQKLADASMYPSAVEMMAASGDRDNRETAVLLDLMAAGVIDQLRGHGSVTIKPARLEEIVERIAPRTRDEDGAWVVTLLPPDGDLIKVNAQDVLDYLSDRWKDSSLTDDDWSEQDIGEFAIAAAVHGATLEDLERAYPGFCKFVIERYRLVDNPTG